MERLLPPKKSDLVPTPAIVDEVTYDEADIVDVRSRSFPAGSEFFNQGSGFQFGEEDDAWTDEEEEDDLHEPECRSQ